jgi:hypothetical protein
MTMGSVCENVRSHIINIDINAVWNVTEHFWTVCVLMHKMPSCPSFCGVCQTNHFKYKMCLMFQPACREDVTNDTVKNLKNSLRCNHAVVFHGVLGHEKREGRSPR